MTSIKRNRIVNGLGKKGFRPAGTDHIHLILYVDEKKTGIWTKVSRGGKEIGDRLIHDMSFQLKLDDNTSFIDLVDCRMSKEQYLQLLRNKGITI